MSLQLTPKKGPNNMTNISIRKGQEAGVQKAPIQSMIEPSRIWSNILKWDPFAEMMPGWSETSPTVFSPDFDVKETSDAFLFKVDLPGVDQKDLAVQLTDNRLTISGSRSEEKEEKTDTTYRSERSFGSFSRAFTLPSGAEHDKINAELNKGVLTVTVPKRPEAQPKQVQIKST